MPCYLNFVRTMKTIGKIKEVLQDFNGNNIIQIICNDYRNVDLINQLDKDKWFDIELKEHKSKRSLEQNKFFWQLLAEIDNRINGTNIELNTYVYLLEKANTKYTYIATLPEAEDDLRKSFRAIKFIKKMEVNGKELNMYKVFYGSSTMNTQEMAMLIEEAIRLAIKVGVPTEYYERELR